MSNRNESGNTELVIGLVGPIGTNLHGVKHVLKKHIESTGYEVHEIKVSSEVIPEIVDVDVAEVDRFERYDRLINAGNDARRMAKELDGLHEGNAALACGAAAVMFAKRA